jgi:hypothetical protein
MIWEKTTRKMTDSLSGWLLPYFLHQQVPADAPLFATGMAFIAPINSFDGAIIGNN